MDPKALSFFTVFYTSGKGRYKWDVVDVRTVTHDSAARDESGPERERGIGVRDTTETCVGTPRPGRKREWVGYGVWERRRTGEPRGGSREERVLRV